VPALLLGIALLALGEVAVRAGGAAGFSSTGALTAVRWFPSRTGRGMSPWSSGEEDVSSAPCPGEGVVERRQQVRLVEDHLQLAERRADQSDVDLHVRG